jgi:uncharacterized protein (TIRG00374 family)
MYNDIASADYRWVYLSMVIYLTSHIARAYRWNLLFESIDYKPSLKNSFIAVMVGYLANIAIPRMGEVSRCMMLQKTDNIPVSSSFGTVVVERIFDMLSLVCVITFAFFVEFDKLSAFVFDLTAKRQINFSFTTILILAIAALIFAAGGFLFVRALKKSAPSDSIIGKIKQFFRGLLEGLTSFTKLKKKKSFLASTFLIWLCYYLQSYVVFFALPFTSHLDWATGLGVLVLGSMGMIIPSPGGIGAFHWIMQMGMTVYGLTEPEGLTFGTVVHSIGMLLVIVVGLLCLAAGLLSAKQKKKSLANQEYEVQLGENIKG